LGGGEYLIEANNAEYKRPLTEADCQMMCDLLETQPYIKKTKIRNGEDYTYNFDTFRNYLSYGRHLVKSHWLSIGLEEGCNIKEKWLEVPPLPKAPIVVSRILKRHGALQWNLLRRYKDHCIFIGHDTEYKEFPIKLKHYKVKNFIEYASVIAGAKLVVSNQTFTFALAEAMKVTRALDFYIMGPNCLPDEGTNGYTDLTENLLEEAIK
jgi:hypothetical protein